MAATSKCLDIAEVLIRSGADVNAKDKVNTLINSSQLPYALTLGFLMSFVMRCCRLKSHTLHSSEKQLSIQRKAKILFNF